MYLQLRLMTSALQVQLMQFKMHKYKLYILFLAALMTAIGSLSDSLTGQTRFQRPDTVPAFSEYRDVDECVASLVRQERAYIRSIRFWIDTAVYDMQIAFKPYPKEQRELGHGCFERFSIDSVPEHDVTEWAGFLLKAGRIDEAWKLLTDRLNTAPDSAHRRALSVAFYSFLMARPVQMDRMQQLYEMGLARIPEDSLERRYLLEQMRVKLGIRVLDTLLIQEAANKMIDIYARLSDRQRERFFPAHEEAYRDASVNRYIDSVRAGSKAQLDYQHEVHNAVYGNQRTFSDFYIEADMPEIKSDYWFYKSYVGRDNKLLQKSEPDHPIPVKGKVNFISFLYACNGAFPMMGGYVREAGPKSCTQYLSVLARLQKRFPQVEFTSVTRTYGVVGASAVLTPEMEADSLAKQFMNSWGLRGNLAVANTDFIRIPGIDNRRIDIETDYERDLNALDPQLINPHTNSQITMGLLVDAKGKIVARLHLNAMLEHIHARLLQAVLERE